MTRTTLLGTVSLVAALALGVAYAQAPPPPGQQPSPPDPGAQQDGPPTGGQASGQPWPIAFVESIEVLRTKGGRDIVIARGLVTSQGWAQPTLMPINNGSPVDGVLDLLFQAHAPAGAAPLGQFMEVDALLPLGHQHPYKAIRVRSANNAVTLKQLPGYAEVKKLKNDCANCLGKYFVAKGGTPPSGVAADNIVKEEDLLWEVRVIRPNQGIPSYQINPNRLTLVLTEDGRISDAAWD